MYIKNINTSEMIFKNKKDVFLLSNYDMQIKYNVLFVFSNLKTIINEQTKN